MITLAVSGVHIYKSVSDGFYYYGRKLEKNDLFIQTTDDEDRAFNIVNKFNELERLK